MEVVRGCATRGVPKARPDQSRWFQWGECAAANALTTGPATTLQLQALSSLRSDGTQLASSINGTAALAERVSRKVRQLDTAQSRVRETLTHIDAAVGRAEAVDGLRAALAADDFEGAAQRVAAFRDLEARFVSDGSAGDDRQLREQHEVRVRE